MTISNVTVSTKNTINSIAIGIDLYFRRPSFILDVSSHIILYSFNEYRPYCFEACKLIIFPAICEGYPSTNFYEPIISHLCWLKPLEVSMIKLVGPKLMLVSTNKLNMYCWQLHLIRLIISNNLNLIFESRNNGICRVFHRFTFVIALSAWMALFVRGWGWGW